MALFTTIHVPFDNGYNVSTSSATYEHATQSTNDAFTQFNNTNIVGRNDFSSTQSFYSARTGYGNLSLIAETSEFRTGTTSNSVETRGATSTTKDVFLSSSFSSRVFFNTRQGSLQTTYTAFTSQSGATTFRGARGTNPAEEIVDDGILAEDENESITGTYNPNVLIPVPAVSSFIKTFPFFSTVETTTEKNVLTSTTINAGEITATTAISLVEFSTTTTETGEPISSTLGSIRLFFGTPITQNSNTTRAQDDLTGQVLYWGENETIYSKRRMVGKNPGDIVGFEEAFEGVIEPDSYYETTVEGLEEPVKVFSKIFTDPSIGTFAWPGPDTVTTVRTSQGGAAGSRATTLTTNGLGDTFEEEKTVMDGDFSTTTTQHVWNEITEDEITASLTAGTSSTNPLDPPTTTDLNVSIVQYSLSASYIVEVDGVKYRANTTTVPTVTIASTSDGENTTFNLINTISGLGTVSTTVTARVSRSVASFEVPDFGNFPNQLTVGDEYEDQFTLQAPERAVTRKLGITVIDTDGGTANSFVRLTRDAVTTSFSPTIMRTHYVSAIGKSYGPMQAVINSPDMRFSNDWGLGVSIPGGATSAVKIQGQPLYANGVFGVTVSPEIISEDTDGKITLASVTQSIDSVTYSTNTDTDVTGDQTSTFQISAIIPGAETIFGNFRYGGWFTTQFGVNWTISNFGRTVVNPFTQIDGDQTEATIYAMGYYSYTSFDRYGNNTFKSSSLFVDEEDRFKPQELTIKDGDVIAFRIAVAPTAYQANAFQGIFFTQTTQWSTDNKPIFSAFTIT